MNANTVIHDSINQVEKITYPEHDAGLRRSQLTRRRLDRPCGRRDAFGQLSPGKAAMAEINKSVSSLMQEAIARAVNVGKTLASVKSPQEAADLHADYMRETFDLRGSPEHGPHFRNRSTRIEGSARPYHRKRQRHDGQMIAQRVKAALESKSKSAMICSDGFAN